MTPADRRRYRPPEPDPQSQQRHSRSGEEPVRRPHDRREAEQRAGGARAGTGSRMAGEQEGDRGCDERGRERLRVEGEADVDVPLPVLPRARPGERTRQQRPDSEEGCRGDADRAAAGGAQADVRGRDDRDRVRGEREHEPDGEREVLVEQADDPERKERDRPEQRPADDSGPARLLVEHERARCERDSEAADRDRPPTVPEPPNGRRAHREHQQGGCTRRAECRPRSARATPRRSRSHRR